MRRSSQIINLKPPARNGILPELLGSGKSVNNLSHSVLGSSVVFNPEPHNKSLSGRGPPETQLIARIGDVMRKVKSCPHS